MVNVITAPPPPSDSPYINTIKKLYLSTLYQLWRLENVLPPGKLSNGFDALYVPQVVYTTGDLDIHDIAIDEAGKPIFVNHCASLAASQP